MIINQPQWIVIDVEGETTGEKYTGNFNIKPYLTLAEKSDVVRLAERLARGILRNETELQFLSILSNVKYHVIESDASWWITNAKEGIEAGFGLYDDKPIFELYEKIKELQQSNKKVTPSSEPKEG